MNETRLVCETRPGSLWWTEREAEMKEMKERKRGNIIRESNHRKEIAVSVGAIFHMYL